MAGESAVANVLSVPAQIGAAQDKITARSAEMQENYKSISELMVEMQNDTKTVGNSADTPLTIRTRELAKMQAEQNTLAIAREAGVNPTFGDDIRAILMRDIRDNTMQLREATTRLRDEQSVSLFDDPLTAVINAFKIPWTQQEVEGIALKKDLLDKSLTQITSGVTSVKQSELAIMQSVNQSSIDDQTNALEGMVRNQKRELQLRGYSANADRIKFMMEADAKQTDLSFKLNQWQNEERMWKITKEMRDIQITEHRWKLDQMKDQQAADVARLGAYNAAAAELNLPQVATIFDLKKKANTSKQTAEFVDDMINKGVILGTPNLRNDLRLGDTLEEIKKFRTMSGLTPRNEYERKYLALVDDAIAQGEAHKKEGKEFKTQEYFNKKWEDTFGIVRKDDGTNPNQAQTFGAMAARAAMTTDSTFKAIFNGVIAPEIDDGNRNLSAHPELVGPMVVKAVQAGKVTPNQGAMFLANFYQASTNLNNELNSPYKFTGRKFDSFKAEVKTDASIGTALTGLGMAGAGGVATAASIPLLGNPFVAGTAVVGGLALGAVNAMKDHKGTFNFTDANEARSYIIKKGYMGSTTLAPGNVTDVITNKPTGAPTK